MAITRAQQVKQMLREGGRIGFRRGAKAPDFNPAQAAANVGKASTASPGRQDPSNFGFDAREAQKSKQYSGITPTDRDGRIIEQYEGTTEMGDVGVVPVPDEERQKKLKKQIQDKKLNLAEKVRLFSLKKLYEQKMEEEEGVFKPIAASVIDSLTPTKLNVYDEVDPAFDMSYYGMSGEDIADVDRLAKAINKGEKTGIISQRDYEDAFYGPEGKPPQGSSGGPDQQLQETDPCKGPNPPAYCFIGDKADETMEAQRNLGGLAPRFAGSIFDFRGMADGGRIGYADGTPSFEEYMRERRGIEQQMSIEQLYKEYIEDMRRKDVAEQKTMAADGGRIGAMEGGIMDLETGRQMYFLGKLVKKATRAVKKIAKSPLGKVAMGAAALKFGPAIFGKGSFNPFLMSPDKGASFDFSGLGKILNKAGLVDLSGGLTLGGKFGLGALTLPFLSDEEEEQDMNMGPELTMEELRAIRNSPYRYMAPRFEGSQYKFAEGGRIGFFKGAVAGGGNISPGTDVKGNVRDDNPFTGGGKDEPPSPPIKDTKQKTPVVVNPIKNLQTHFANNQKLKDAVALGLITNNEYNILGGYDAKQTLGMGPVDTGLSSLAYNVVQSFKGDQPFSDIFGDVARNVKGASNISPELQTKYENIMKMADGGRIGLKDGNGVADEEAENAKFVKRVRELMDEGFDIGEAVREAMKEGYAEGGRTGFFMGSKLPQGLALVRQMLRFFSEGSKTGKTGSEMLKIVNPKKFTKYLEDPSTLFMKGSTKDGIMASDVVKDYASKVKGDRTKMIEDLLGSAKNIKQAEKFTEKFKKEIIEEMISKGSDKEVAESSAEILSNIAESAAGGKEIMKYKPKITDEGILQLEQIVKNLKTGGKSARDLNADGGRIGLRKGTVIKEGLEKLAQLLKKEKARTQRISGNLRLENMQRTKIGKPKKGVDYDYYRELLDDDENFIVMGDETEDLLKAMVKEQEAEMAYMKRLYDKGALNPTAGETTMGRLRMLEDKAQSGEVLSADEIAEIKRLSEIFNKADGGRIGLKDGTGSKILNFFKPFSGKTKGSKQLEGILYGEPGIAEILNLLTQSGNFGLFSEGGDVEPVAKKTMPLLDMGGKEMDLRENGGFVPIGRMEKADDVPARLSKNEFVFTADAVRNAGDGDVDKGAEVMYNMMKNLESGGDVSEESQGLKGAREMFQTSKRLEEVL